MRTDIVLELDALIKAKGTEISRWFEEKFRETPPPFYASVDLRHSGFKIAPVDTNLFPAGFHLLSAAAQPRAAVAFRRRLSRDFPEAHKIVLLAENHTRNLNYLDNLFMLRALLAESGAEVVIGRTEGPETLFLPTATGQTVEEQPLIRREGKLQTRDGFIPDLVIVNNDLTAGVPEVLQDISQPVLPSPQSGWHRRRKSRHFEAYSQVAHDFAQAFGLDCWKIWAQFEACGDIDFKERHGLDKLADSAAAMLEKIRAKYAKYGVTAEPYLFVKADAGTYGMGIMTLRDPQELRDLNKKNRNKMHIVKEGAQNAQVIIQEGVPSVDKVSGAPAEPMIYCADGQAVGGAFRFNPERDAEGNLNAQGMRFAGMCDQLSPEENDKVAVESCNYAVYGLVARLANLAAAREG